MHEQWRAGLRVSEALDLEVRDLSLDTASPTLRVRSGKGGKTRLVPIHPELHGALSSALAYGDISQGRIIEAHPTTAWRWVQAAVKRAEELGAISPGKRIGTHILPDTQYIGRLFLTLRQISTRRFCRGSCLEWRCPRCASTLFVALKLHNQVHHFFLEFLIGSQFNPPYRVISTLLMDCHRVAYLQ